MQKYNFNGHINASKLSRNMLWGVTHVSFIYRNRILNRWPLSISSEKYPNLLQKYFVIYINLCPYAGCYYYHLSELFQIFDLTYSTYVWQVAGVVSMICKGLQKVLINVAHSSSFIRIHKYKLWVNLNSYSPWCIVHNCNFIVLCFHIIGSKIYCCHRYKCKHNY